MNQCFWIPGSLTMSLPDFSIGGLALRTYEARVSIETCLAAVAAETGLTVGELVARDRRARIARARHLAAKLAREKTRHSYKVIGRHLGGRSSDTIKASIKAADKVLRAPEWSSLYERAEARV